MVLDEKSHHVGGLSCHSNIIHIVFTREADKQVRGNHHGNIVKVYFVGCRMENDLLEEFQKSLNEQNTQITPFG